MERAKKTLFSEVQVMVNDLLFGISQEIQIKILISLVLICIKAIQYEHQSFIPGTASNTEFILYGEIALLKDEYKKYIPKSVQEREVRKVEEKMEVCIGVFVNTYNDIREIVKLVSEIQKEYRCHCTLNVNLPNKVSGIKLTHASKG